MSRINEKAQLQKKLSLVFIAINALADTSNKMKQSEKFLLLSKNFKKQKYLASRSFILKFN